MTTHLAALLDVRLREPEDALKRLHRHRAVLLHGHAQVAHRKHARPVRRVEAQLHLRLDFLLVRHLWVVHKRAAARARRLVARRCVFEALDDRRLSRAVVADNNGHGREELDDGQLLVVKGADTPNGELVEARHCVGRTRVDEGGGYPKDAPLGATRFA
jgi:hypothetical protein